MEKIAVVNRKGGVGKSTTAHYIGAYFARKGAKVLLVDLDSNVGCLCFDPYLLSEAVLGEFKSAEV